MNKNKINNTYFDTSVGALPVLIVTGLRLACPRSVIVLLL